MSASRSSPRRVFRIVGLMSPQAVRRSRKFSGLRLSSQMTRSCQRLPSKSSRAMMGRPVFEPRTGLPGRAVLVMCTQIATFCVAVQ
jgi:hypothetical protein